MLWYSMARTTHQIPGAYEQVYRESIEDPAGFWGKAAEDVSWIRRWDAVRDTSASPFTRWFPGALVNTCYNALDRHVEAGIGDRTALIYDSPVTDAVRTYTYASLLDEVARFAGGLSRMGVRAGDRVVIYMPMVPEAAIAMLACARIGAIHSVVFGGFAAEELAKRIRDAEPVVIISASCGIEVNRIIPYKPLLDEAISLSGVRPRHVVILPRPQEEAAMMPGRDLIWDDLTTGEPAPCTPVHSTDPLYILYTSGTTGVPKGVVRDNGGHLVALRWSMQNIYGVSPGETFWAASDVGWVVGHSYIVYAPLFSGCTTVLYEGKSVGTPDAGSLWRVIERHGVDLLFCAPTAFRAIYREDPGGEHIHRYRMDTLRTLFLAGERCDPDTLLWAQKHLGIPVIDHWWQTESGWPMGANPVGIERFPVRPGSCTRAVPGYDIQVLSEDGECVSPGTIGNLAVRLPLPPGCLTTLWRRDQDCVDTYFSRYPGYYHTSDSGYIDEDGYLWVMSRTDDIINVAGHRLSTGAIEEVLSSHPAVAECAVTGVADPVKGEIPLGFLVLKEGFGDDGVVDECIRLVRARIGPIASFKTATVVSRLPKTRSGKVLRRTLKQIADGTPFSIPATIDDPAVLDDVAAALGRLGYPGERITPEDTPG